MPVAENQTLVALAKKATRFHDFITELEQMRKSLKDAQIRFFAINLHPSNLTIGRWRISFEPDSIAGRRLQNDLEYLIERASLEAGAPATADLLNWWMAKSIDEKTAFRRDPIEQSISLCQKLSIKFARLAGGRLSREPYQCYSLSFLLDRSQDATEEHEYLIEHIWVSFESYIAELVGSQERAWLAAEWAKRHSSDAHVNSVGKSRVEHNREVARRIRKLRDADRQVLEGRALAITYDAAVLTGNHILDRGLKGTAAMNAYATETAALVNDIRSHCSASATKLGLTAREKKFEDIDFAAPFRDVGADLKSITLTHILEADSDRKLAGQSAPMPRVDAVGRTPSFAELQTLAQECFPFPSKEVAASLMPEIAKLEHSAFGESLKQTVADAERVVRATYGDAWEFIAGRRAVGNVYGGGERSPVVAATVQSGHSKSDGARSREAPKPSNPPSGRKPCIAVNGRALLAIRAGQTRAVFYQNILLNKHSKNRHGRLANDTIERFEKGNKASPRTLEILIPFLAKKLNQNGEELKEKLTAKTAAT